MASSVAVSFDARQLKSEVSAILDRKIGAVRKDPNLYDKLARMWLLLLQDRYDEIDFPYETGALLEGEHRVRGRRERTGYTKSNAKNGVMFSAEEKYTYKYGSRDGRYGPGDIRELNYTSFVEDLIRQANANAMNNQGVWGEFIEEATGFIVEAMNKA